MKWLFEEEKYIPAADKDAFTDRSILSIVRLLSLIQRSNEHSGEHFMHKVNPGLKLVAVLIAVLLLSLSRNPLFVLLISIPALCGLIILEPENRKKAFALCMLALSLTLIMLIPSMLMGNLRNSLLLLLKLAGSISLLQGFSYTTRWHEASKAFKLIYIPDIFILIFDLSIRYIFLLGEMSLEMLHALKTRSIGINKEKFATISRLIGNLFIKSVEAGNEMYYAMECRGYTGDYTAAADTRLGLPDLVLLAAAIAIIGLYILLGR